ncbi:DNA polymerase III subunit beta [Candidatus Pantoea edessiphila]|uniref:Beta sliding clamp n=1 Tax=Candidatus Pantoea edessiphila TaxID=2044610 RepID=A0A2P5T199_9GAMM|nr:DNA polymerase III subunit beta [Candidatus Pantoea edessiphila]PPI88348.1 DNA polymerase III subunit beta [Candidatus Pantoea edessiphila]
MKIIIEREKLIKPLQQISSLISSRPIKPIIGNILIEVNDKFLFLTATDLEIEMVTSIDIKSDQLGSITVPGRKFLEICRSLPKGSLINIESKNNRMLISSGCSRFSLSTLSSENFPNLDDWHIEVEFNLLQSNLKNLIELTKFSMGYQDIRHYLNGIMLETSDKKIRAVATDGHRLATCFIKIDYILPNYSVIVPRKGVVELARLLNGENTNLKIQIGSNNIRVYTKEIVFTSRLIDGSFPDYKKVLKNNYDKFLDIDCILLKQALSRSAIISCEKFKGVRLNITKNQLKITSNNSNNEESEEILEIGYHGDELEICFNVFYVIDILNVLKCEEVRLSFIDSISRIHIEDIKNPFASYIVMPIRI